jgi:hypothetical protein
MGQRAGLMINLDGGLNLSDTHATLQEKPGTCKVLDNYEVTPEGGYRRVNGYSKFGTAQPTGAADTIFGVYPYADGVIAIASDGVYFSTDGTTWVQVNRDTYVAQTGTVEVVGGSLNAVVGTGTLFTTEYVVGDHIRINGQIRLISAITDNTNLTVSVDFSGAVAATEPHYKNGTGTLSGSVIARTSQGVSEIAWLEEDGEYGSIIITDTTGNNNAARVRFTGSGGARVYEYDDLNETDFVIPTTPLHVAVFQQRAIVANAYIASDIEGGVVAWSDRYQNKRWDGASSGSVTVDSPVVALKPFRDRLLIFCKNSIYQLSNINDASTLEVLPISYKTGCAAAGSIQEIAGDVIFLSYDGIRTLTATDRYGDTTFSLISYDIEEYVKTIIRDTSSVTISSCVINDKNQYRLFYTASGYTAASQLGLCGTVRKNRFGELEWQWARLKEWPVACVSSANNPFIVAGTKDERVFHGGYDGYVYEHDTGGSFDGSDITATMELNEIDYGDLGVKKTLHYVQLLGEIDGSTDTVTLSIEYDFNSSRTMQPTNSFDFTLDSLLPKYGTAIYGTATYVAGGRYVERANVEGSGYSNNFIITSTGIQTPYTINSLFVDLRLGANH